ncbi:unnamed protein product [Pieris macdunnoughi]|nr:unnamed protein product [Pieris macdunnoughi]
MEVIPSFMALHRVKLTSQSPLSKTITHLIVEYISLISKLSIEFDQRESVLVFHVQFPFVPIPFGVVGFSSLYDEGHSPLYPWKNQYDAYKDVIQQFLVANVDN